MTDSELTLAVLREIRDEIRTTRGDVAQRIDATNQRLDVTNQRLDLVEGTLLELAEQQRFVVRYTRALSERDLRLEGEVRGLDDRVQALERRVDDLEG